MRLRLPSCLLLIPIGISVLGQTSKSVPVFPEVPVVLVQAITPQGAVIGNGVIVHPGGLVVTGTALIERATKVWVWLGERAVVAGRTIAIKRDAQIAFLRLFASGLPSLPYHFDAVKVGGRVIVVGYEMGRRGKMLLPSWQVREGEVVVIHRRRGWEFFELNVPARQVRWGALVAQGSRMHPVGIVGVRDIRRGKVKVISVQGVMRIARELAVQHHLPSPPPSPFFTTPSKMTPLALGYLLLGRVKESLRQSGLAMAFYRKAIQADPKATLPYLMVASLKLHGGFPKSARFDLERIRVFHAQDPQWHVAWGRMLLLEGYPKKALKAFLKARNLDPTNFDALFYAGKANALLRRWGEAITFYLLALHLNPDDTPCRVGLAEAYRKKGLWASAVRELKQALKRSPDDPLLLEALGRAYLDGEVWEKALEVFSEGVQRHPHHVPFRLGLAKASLGLNDSLSTLKACRQALFLDPNEDEAYVLMGQAYELEGRWDEAKDAFRKGLRLNPNNPEGWLGLARVALQERDFDTALIAAKRVLVIDPSRAAAFLYIGIVYRDKGRLKQAAEAFRKCITVAEKDPKQARWMKAAQAALQGLLRASSRP